MHHHPYSVVTSLWWKSSCCCCQFYCRSCWRTAVPSRGEHVGVDKGSLEWIAHQSQLRRVSLVSTAAKHTHRGQGWWEDCRSWPDHWWRWSSDAAWYACGVCCSRGKRKSCAVAVGNCNVLGVCSQARSRRCRGENEIKRPWTTVSRPLFQRTTGNCLWFNGVDPQPCLCCIFMPVCEDTPIMAWRLAVKILPQRWIKSWSLWTATNFVLFDLTGYVLSQDLVSSKT